MLKLNFGFFTWVYLERGAQTFVGLVDLKSDENSGFQILNQVAYVLKIPYK